MKKKHSLTRTYSNAELSLESIEDLAVEQIQQENEKEQALIDEIHEEYFEMNDHKIDEVVQILVNEELRCDICRCIPCAMVMKQVTVERMISNLSKNGI